MKTIREYLRKWLVGDLVDMAKEVSAIKELQVQIEKHLGSVSSLADYVKEKDEKAQAMFEVIESTKPTDQMTEAEVAQELQSALGVKSALLDSPAIGTREVVEKNNKLGQIDTFIQELRKKQGAF